MCHFFSFKIFFIFNLYIIKSVMTALDHRGLSRCPVPITILDENYFGDDIDSLDTDEFLKELSGKDMQHINVEWLW